MTYIVFMYYRVSQQVLAKITKQSWINSQTVCSLRKLPENNLTELWNVKNGVWICLNYN